MCSPKDSSWSKMTPRSRTEMEKRKVGNSAERDSESSLSSCWRVPNQIYWVLCGFSSKRLDDIQALRASVAWDIVRIAEAIGTGIDIFNIWSSDAGWLDKILSVIEKLDTRIDKTIGWNENLSCKSEIQSCLSYYYGFFASSVSKNC